MKTLKYIVGLSAILIVFFNCSEDDNNLSFIENVTAPTNVSALFQITQDNSGLVTITPSAESAISYNITLGDNSEIITIKQGASAQHVYEEGSYSVNIEAVGVTGLKSEVTKDIVVSFKAPENLVVTIENDAALSKQVNVVATADFAMFFEVYFGEPGYDEPVVGNIGEVVSYTYEEAGLYTIRVVAKGGAVETTEYTQEFEVTAILQPISNAPAPPRRDASEVISIYSDAYTSLAGINFYPNWNQETTYTEIDVDGNNIIQYGSLNYQGIDFGSNVDASAMEYLHIDVWTADLDALEIFPISVSTGEKSVVKDLVADQWVSFDIPLSDFTDQGLSMADIFQFKFVGAALPSGELGTIFLDNIYFWKESDTYSALLFDDFEGAGNITTWAGDAAGLNTSFENPYVNADNFSAKVLEYSDTGGQYANVQFVADSKFNLSGGNSVFVLKIYVPSSSVTGTQPNQISLKLQNSDLEGNAYTTQTEIIKPLVLDTWQEISFDFATDNFINLDAGSVNPINRTDLDKVVIQINSENNNDQVKAYIDDFKYGTTPPSDFPPFARDGFEGFGTITTWTGDNCGIDTAFANPFVDSNNNSATVLQYNDGGGQYANVQFTVTPVFNLTSKNKFTLKIYVPSSSVTGSQPNQISLKLQNSSLGGTSYTTQTEIIKPIVLDAWQEITFDFANDTFISLDTNSPDPVDRTDLDKVVLQVNSENNNDLVIAYIDDFNYHN